MGDRTHVQSFGLESTADLFQKLKEEQADFAQSNYLTPRHALNAIMTGYHMHEWVLAELRKRPDCQHRSRGTFRAYLKELTGSLIEDAGLITDGTKHFVPKGITTGKHRGAFQPGVFQPDAFDVSHLWLERNGQKHRAEDFIAELVQFWEWFFEEHKLPRYGHGAGRARVTKDTK